jgi:hypothetical protein
VRVKKSSGFSLAATAALLLSFCHADAQLISRDNYPLWEKEGYENISRLGYRDFDERDVERRVYDPFGVYLIDGVPVFSLQETRTDGPERGSAIFKSPLYPGIFRNLMVGMDSYQGWSASIMVGDAIPTRFSPLTLNLSRLNGIRFDASSRKSSFSIIGSRVSDPVLLATGLTRSGVQVNSEGISGNPSFGTYLVGGHWETNLGSVLKLGSTYVNVHNFDAIAGRKDGSLKGAVPFSSLEEARSVFVIVSDDSYWDDNGPRVFRMQIHIDGEQRDDIEPMVRLVRSVPVLIGESNREIGLGDSEISLQRADRPSWLIESYLMEEIVKEGYTRSGALSTFTSGGLFFNSGEDVSHAETPFLEANGTDILIYRFEVPSDAKQVRFRALAAGDYVIDVASALGWIGNDVQWRDWHTVKRAADNIQDQSNMGWVSFRYGFPTGTVLYGVNFEANLLGFQAWGEFSRNTSYFRYPSGSGKRLSTNGDAYFVNLYRDMGSWDAGFEYANMPSDYSTTFQALMQNPRQNVISSFQLVDDNDDRDEWPDRWEQNRSFASLNLTPAPGSGMGFGVFPGLDVDRDGVQDNVWYNGANRILTYYDQPFFFGDDFNNNGQIDGWENDNRADYPYDLDSRGGHGFVTWRPLPKVDDAFVRAGYYNMHQPGGGGSDRASYVKASYVESWPGLGRIQAGYYGKRVRDDIRNDLYRFTGGSYSVLPDRLLLRNSLQNTLVFGVHLNTDALPSLNVYNDVLIEVNSQREIDDGDFFQSSGRLTTVGYVARADYTWHIGENFTFGPMLKGTIRRTKAELETLKQDTYTITPMFRGDYRLAEKTVVRGGLLGLPFREIHRDRDRPFLDRDSWYYILVLENFGNYRGIDVSTSIGFERVFDRYISSHRVSAGRERYYIRMRIG